MTYLDNSIAWCNPGNKDCLYPTDMLGSGLKNSHNKDLSTPEPSPRKQAAYLNNMMPGPDAPVLTNLTTTFDTPWTLEVRNK
jgi:hypothetical protein